MHVANYLSKWFLLRPNT